MGCKLGHSTYMCTRQWRYTACVHKLVFDQFEYSQNQCSFVELVNNYLEIVAECLLSECCIHTLNWASICNITTYANFTLLYIYIMIQSLHSYYEFVHNKLWCRIFLGSLGCFAYMLSFDFDTDGRSVHMYIILVHVAWLL